MTFLVHILGGMLLFLGVIGGVLLSLIISSGAAKDDVWLTLRVLVYSTVLFGLGVGLILI